MENKLKLSEIIKTDCYIDCGSNEKLREVVQLLPIEQARIQIKIGIHRQDTKIKIFSNPLEYITMFDPMEDYPTHHISQIDLNA